MKLHQIFDFVTRACDSWVELPCKDYKDKQAFNVNIRLRRKRVQDEQWCVLILLTGLNSACSATSISWSLYRPCLSDHSEQLYLLWSSWKLRTLVMLNVPSEFSRIVVVELEVRFLSYWYQFIMASGYTPLKLHCICLGPAIWLENSPVHCPE